MSLHREHCPLQTLQWAGRSLRKRKIVNNRLDFFLNWKFAIRTDSDHIDTAFRVDPHHKLCVIKGLAINVGFSYQNFLLLMSKRFHFNEEGICSLACCSYYLINLVR